MRGTLLDCGDFLFIRRIIPADAGNTIAYGSREDFREDHPRGCGEHYSYCLPVAGDGGSSPRMRGTQRLEFFLFGLDGIIPADAGNTDRSL